MSNTITDIDRRISELETDLRDLKALTAETHPGVWRMQAKIERQRAALGAMNQRQASLRFAIKVHESVHGQRRWCFRCARTRRVWSAGHVAGPATGGVAARFTVCRACTRTRPGCTTTPAQKPVPVQSPYIVNNGNIRDDALTDGRFASMPLHMKGEAGNGIGRRQCTNEYKLTPIKRKVRELLGASKVVTPSGLATVGRVPGKPGTRFVNMWVGISTDEIERVRPSDVSYIRRSDPLIDVLNMSRDDCERYLAERWPHPVSRSSCIGCPYHDNKTWREMRDGDPVAFADRRRL